MFGAADKSFVLGILVNEVNKRIQNVRCEDKSSYFRELLLLYCGFNHRIVRGRKSLRRNNRAASYNDLVKYALCRLHVPHHLYNIKWHVTARSNMRVGDVRPHDDSRSVAYHFTHPVVSIKLSGEPPMLVSA